MNIDLIDNRPIKQPSPVTNKMAEAFLSNSKFCVRFHARISGQCLMNQATGRVTAQALPGNPPTCPPGPGHPAAKALRTATSRSTFRLPGSTVNTIDDPDTIHQRRRSRETRP